LVPEVTEIESGKRNDRPRLAEALRLGRIHDATLAIARLDKLSRNAHFLWSLQEAGVKFVACDMPFADNFTVGILSMVAQKEREMISDRTQKALAQKKIRLANLSDDERAELIAKGKAVRLGGKTESLAGQATRRATASAKVRGDKATARALDVLPIIRELQTAGASLLKIAADLTARSIPRAREGAVWTADGVKRALDRVT
jgi:DNA invertase Pin-like site-specific DNA recombinase